MKRKLAVLVALGVLVGSLAPTALADRGGGPGSNHGCPGHQPPPPPGGGCGK